MGYAHDWRKAETSDAVPCRKCNELGSVEYREWESSCGGYEDYHYRCTACGQDWWIEGPDA